MKLHKKILPILFAFGIGCSLLTTIKPISAATDPTTAPSDWAFNETSIPFHDAILAKYPTIDSNNDSYISISEAGAYTGELFMTNDASTNPSSFGTMDGIGYFTNITKLNLSNYNFLTLSEEIGNLTNLQHLSINNTYLENGIYLENGYAGSTIPDSIGNLVNLTTLYITGTLLEGPIPDSIGNLTNLASLKIADNSMLTGSLPTSIGNLSNLNTLYISDSQISGPIPDSIGNLTNTTTITLTKNQLTGSIPDSIGNLTNTFSITLDNNQLSGNLPNTIGNMISLQYLSINNNQLSGTIPDSIGNLSFLYSFFAENNQFSGSLPESMGALPLQWIHLTNNQLSGEIPPTFYTNPAIYSFLVGGNTNLQGNPAEGFKQHSMLGQLDVSGTHLNQARPDIPDYQLMYFINDNLAANLLFPDKTDIVEGLIQEDIDHAQESCDWIIDPIEKQQWQEDIDLAQSFLDAKQAVEDLFTDTTHTAIPDDLTMDDILAAEDIVNAIPDGTVKTTLLEEIEKAKRLLKAKEAVDSLYQDETTIRDDLVQEDIDDAQDIVDILDNGPFKDALQVRIDEAQRQLDARGLLPTLISNMDKTLTKNFISTTDSTSIVPITFFLSISILGIVWLKRKKLEA